MLKLGILINGLLIKLTMQDSQKLQIKCISNKKDLALISISVASLLPIN